jgi:hypothetical protein
MKEVAMGKKEKLVFENMESLNPIKKIINEAGKTLKDPSNIEFSNDVKEILGGTFGGVLGAGVGASLVVGVGTGAGAVAMTSGLATLGGVIGGGMFAGIAVAALPAVALAGAGTYYISKKNKEKVKQEKEILIQQIILKQSAIQKVLKDKVNEQDSRLEHLNNILVLLNNARNELESDIKKAS